MASVPQESDLLFMRKYREILNKYNIKTSKRLGQNFLVDSSYLDAIVEAADLSAEDLVLEIGAGVGNLTMRLSAVAGKVIAVEFDRRMSTALRGELNAKNVEIVEDDALKLNYRELLKHYGGGIKVVANLPYNIATEIIFRLLEYKDLFDKMFLMTQLEVARRITADVGKKEYGVLALLTNLWADTKIAFVVPRGAFRPAPKVDSALVRFALLPQPKVHVDDESLYKKVVKAAFAQRRKKLVNSFLSSSLELDKSSVEIWLKAAGVDKERRAEEVTMEEFARLSNTLFSFMGSSAKK